MNDNKEHIEFIERQPKKPEEALEAIQAALNRFATTREAVEYIAQLNVQARAEGYAAGRDAGFNEAWNRAQDQINDSYKQLAAAQTQLSHCENELRRTGLVNEALQTKLAAERAEAETDHELLVGVVHALETKLAAAQAEIERLKAATRFTVDDFAAMAASETRLNNLRAASRRYLQMVEDGSIGRSAGAVFRAAIEESEL